MCPEKSNAHVVEAGGLTLSGIDVYCFTYHLYLITSCEIHELQPPS